MLLVGKNPIALAKRRKKHYKNIVIGMIVDSYGCSAMHPEQRQVELDNCKLTSSA